MTQDSPKPLNPVEIWIASRATKILAVVGMIMVIGAGLAVYALVDEQKRLAGVGVAGPCRAKGIDNSECRKQARLIFKACADQPERCARLYGISVRPWARPGVEDAVEPRPTLSTETPSSTTATTTAPSSKGGDAFQPSTGHQPPGPGDPGPQGGGNDDRGQGAAPGPSPAPGGSAAPEGGPPAETPGNGAEGASPSGAAVEVCVLERTCVGAEVDVAPKGLIP